MFNNDKLVIGKGADDGTLTPLTADDLKMCKKLNFKVKEDEKKKEVKKDEEEKEEDGDNEEEEDDE